LGDYGEDYDLEADAIIRDLMESAIDAPDHAVTEELCRNLSKHRLERFDYRKEIAAAKAAGAAWHYTSATVASGDDSLTGK
jgi:hypothetical protein